MYKADEPPKVINTAAHSRGTPPQHLDVHFPPDRAEFLSWKPIYN